MIEKEKLIDSRSNDWYKKTTSKDASRMALPCGV